MTPSPEAEKAAKEIAEKFPPMLGGEQFIERKITNLLSTERAKAEAEFQARLGKWREVVEEIFDRYEKMMMVLPTEGDIGMLQRLYALLSSTDALSAQAREAEIRAEAFEEAVKEFASRSNEGGNSSGGWCCSQADASARQWAYEAAQIWCEDRAAAERAKAAPADKPKEDAH